MLLVHVVNAPQEHHVSIDAAWFWVPGSHTEHLIQLWVATIIAQLLKGTPAVGTQSSSQSLVLRVGLLRYCLPIMPSASRVGSNLLSQLTHLGISGNGITGSLPESWSSLTSVSPVALL